MFSWLSEYWPKIVQDICLVVFAFLLLGVVPLGLFTGVWIGVALVGSFISALIALLLGSYGEFYTNL